MSMKWKGKLRKEPNQKGKKSKNTDIPLNRLLSIGGRMLKGKGHIYSKKLSPRWSFI